MSENSKMDEELGLITDEEIKEAAFEEAYQQSHNVDPYIKTQEEEMERMINAAQEGTSIRSDTLSTADDLQSDVLGNDQAKEENAVEGMQHTRRERIRGYGTDAPILTVEDAVRREYGELFQSQIHANATNPLTVKILSGVIDGYEYNEMIKMGIVSLHYGHFEVKIPVNMLTQIDERYEEMTDTEKKIYMNRIMSRMESSKIDFVVHSIDEEERFAIGDRVRALEVKRARHFYYKRDRTNPNAIHAGDKVQARVLGVTQSVLYIEYGGVEESLGIADCTYLRTRDLRGNVFGDLGDTQIHPGDDIAVIVKEVELTGRANGFGVKAHASVKEAYPDPRLREFHKLAPGQRKAGIVSFTTPRGFVMVRLIGMPIDVSCTYRDSRGFLPREGDRVSVLIKACDPKNIYVVGEIRHIV